MTLSWGHGAPEPEPPKRRDRSTVIVGVVGGLALGAGILFSVFTQVGPSDDDAARTAITDLLVQRRDAAMHRDLDGYMRTVDPARVFLRGCEQQRFEAGLRLGLAPENVTLGKISKWGDYLRVWLDTETGLQRSFARNDGARWYMSEPTSGELGEDITREYAGVRVHYRAVEDDIGEIVGDELASIIDTVVPHAAAQPAKLFELRIATLTSTNGQCFIAGQAEGRGSTLITVKDVRLTPGYNHLSRVTSATIEHEALHWLQRDHAPLLRSMDWWLVEGWPYAIANTPSIPLRRFAICTGAPSYEDLRLGMRPDALPEDVERAYIAAAMLVERASKGTDDRAYWRIVDAFGVDGGTDPFTAALGVDGRSFFTSWLSDARRQYC